MRLLAALLVLLVLGVHMPAALASKTTTLRGTASHVSDGDTLWLRPADGRRPIKLRLLGIDAPEICQPGGRAARQALADRVSMRTLRAELQAYDDYGRGLARVTAGGVDVGEALVRDGLAWAHHYRGRAGPYDDAERVARAGRRGLFADPRAITPREFRRLHGPCEQCRGRCSNASTPTSSR